MFQKMISLKNGERVLIRSFSISDILPIHVMYGGLSDESKRFFRPHFFVYASPKSLVSNLTLLLASFSRMRRLLANLSPKAVSPSIVAVNARNELIGFYYLIYSSTMGSCVRDDYQNLGLGSRMGLELITLARKEKIREIYALVPSENSRAIHVCRKHGWKTLRLIKRYARWKGKDYDCLLMRKRL